MFARLGFTRVPRIVVSRGALTLPAVARQNPFLDFDFLDYQILAAPLPFDADPLASVR